MNRNHPREYQIDRQNSFQPPRSDENLLQAENERLRELVVQLSAIILKNVADRK
jgi:hypothetical protein